MTRNSINLIEIDLRSRSRSPKHLKHISSHNFWTSHHRDVPHDAKCSLHHGQTGRCSQIWRAMYRFLAT